MKEFLQHELFVYKDYHLSVLQLFVVVVVIAIAWVFTKGLKKIMVDRGNYTELERGRRLSVFQLVQYTIWVAVLLLTLEALGFKLTLLLAGSAALLVGIGLGLQEVFKDFISGVILLFDGTIRVSDVIETDGVVGRVKEIRLRASEVETRDGIVMIIPNGRFISGNVVNWTHNRKLTRFNVEVGVAYGSDVRKVEQILIECAKNHPDVVKTPEPFVFFTDFGDSQLTFKVLFFSRNVFKIEFVKSDLRFAIEDAFRKNNITIPFPQRDIWIKRDK
ncbi:MAG: mechanosensitive ion channel [Flavobacteriales bacterium]|nr:mechanosensitive ion channel [Flavobacteriales bacterium]